MTPSELKALLALCQGEGQLWTATAEVLEDAILVVDADRRVVYLNPSGERLFGVHRDRVQGQRCTDAFDCPNCACECRLFRRGSLEQVPVTIYSRDDSQRRLVHKSGRILRNAGGEPIAGVEILRSQPLPPELASLPAGEEAAGGAAGSGPTGRVVGHATLTLDGSLVVQAVSGLTGGLAGLAGLELVGKKLSELVPGGSGGPDCLLEPLLSGLCVSTFLEAPTGPLPVAMSLETAAEGYQLHLRGARGPSLPLPSPQSSFHGLLSVAPAMQTVFRVLERAANTEAGILIEGETGTGKELVARALHRLSSRRREPFTAVNCATLRGELLLSELFGHEKGAFTGALQQKPGRLELAGKGTLLLDEVQEIPLEHQPLLLRVLEERVFERLGGHRSVPFEARILAATNTPLIQAVEQGRFRRDLFHRLNVIPIALPPLRARREDIPLLVQHFLARAAANQPGAATSLSPEALEALQAYDWPGNVRELKNLMMFLAFQSQGRVELWDLPEAVRGAHGLEGQASAAPGAGPEKGRSRGADTQQADRLPARATPLPASPAGLGASSGDERERIQQALLATRYHRGRAAELLGMDRTTLWRKLRRYGLDGEGPG